MQSANFESIGPSKLLAFVRGDLRAAKSSLLIVGPWIDDYFASEVTQVARKELTVRCLSRPEHQTDPVVWKRMCAGLATFRFHWPRFESRTLETLHAKCLLIDERIFYCGSANWYRFSLEQGGELTIRGLADEVRGLTSQLAAFWEQGQNIHIQPPNAVPVKPPAGIRTEIIDPLAARVLASDPKAFVIGKKRSK